MAARISVTKIKKKGTSNKREISRELSLQTTHIRYATARLLFPGRSYEKLKSRSVKTGKVMLQFVSSCISLHLTVLTDPCV